MRASKHGPPHSHFKPMGVDDVTFLVDRLGADCAPLQFVRELTENAIAAIDALPDRSGIIVWDVDWNRFELTGYYKLAIIDTGIGMTGEEMVAYINNLSSSVHVQSKTGNYGVGAKIAAAPFNHAGLVYLSWKDGQGYMIHLCRDPETDKYGLVQFEHPGGRSEHWAYVEDSIKPEAIQSHGTMVVLLGMKEDQDTMHPPQGTPMPSRWVLRYLNSRYFEFPQGIAVKAREGWDLPRNDSHNFLRTVSGMRTWLAENSQTSGTVPLKNAVARWWIVREDVDKDSGHVIPNGHMGALYQDELYELSTGRAGVARLQSFGVIFGYQRVVIYLEPKISRSVELIPNTARTQLILNGNELPWEEWASEFRENLPGELERLIEEAGANAAATDHRQSIRDRLKQIRDLFRISRYRKAPDGLHRIQEDRTVPGGTPKRVSERTQSGDGRSGGARGGRAGDIYALFLTSGGAPAKEIEADNDPTPKWISVADGTRIPPDLEDRAAKYIPEQNLILINADFRVFTDMVDRWVKRLGTISGSQVVVEQVVREWFEQQLIEAVLGAQALCRSTEWTSEDLASLWSEEALTAVVLPRYHVDNSIKRALGSKFGSLKEQVA